LIFFSLNAVVHKDWAGGLKWLCFSLILGWNVGQNTRFLTPPKQIPRLCIIGPYIYSWPLFTLAVTRMFVERVEGHLQSASSTSMISWR
jgi:hypothetical protein